MKKVVNGALVEMTDEEVARLERAKEEYISSDEYKRERISCLKQMLTDTDYIACKLIEGVATKEDYAELLEQREKWREEIRRLENEKK